jgi:hypothetical protein
MDKAMTITDKVISNYKKLSNELTGKSTLTYVNKFGETLTFLTNEQGSPYINHTDIHEEGEFYPTDVKMFWVLDDDEKAVIHLFETICIISQKK